MRAVYFESGGTIFPFLLICSFFFSTHALLFPFLPIFCFFLGLCLSEMDTCIETCTCLLLTHKNKQQNSVSKNSTHSLIFFISTTLILRATLPIFTSGLWRSCAQRRWTTSEYKVLFSTLCTVAEQTP